MRMQFEQPAAEWTECLPVGNGHLGGMVSGGFSSEHISLNEDTLWSSGPTRYENPLALEHLDEVRRLLFEGRYVEGEKLAQQTMTTRNEERFGAYQPLGELNIQFGHRDEDVNAYARCLDLDSGIASVECEVDGNRITREIFCSYPDRVMVVRLESSAPVAFSVKLSTPHEAAARTTAPDEITVSGKVLNGITRFVTLLKVISEEGQIEQSEDGLAVKDTGAVLILLAATTDYSGGAPAEVCRADLDRAGARSYGELRQAHLNDHQALYRRVSLEFGDFPDDDILLEDLLKNAQETGADPRLFALAFQYGRYLLIASSREGTTPANLQGIWNDCTEPEWNCDYHLNINLQMNYWAAEVANLPECHLPLFDFMESIMDAGRVTAREHYNCPGWVAHWSTSVWHFTTPGWETSWGLWPVGGAWLCQHLWEHYAFGGDNTFLERAYTILKGAAEFFLAYLVEDPERGCLVSGPSTSPENAFLTPDGHQAYISMGPACDMEIIHELFTNCARASEILNVDDDFRRQLTDARARLAPLRINDKGRLQEWQIDFDEAEPGHRHLSHLYAFYPGCQITLRDSPALSEAVRRSVERRVESGSGTCDGGVGWSWVWLAALWARMEEGDKAYEDLATYFRGMLLPNLFAHCWRVPQLDATLGFSAAVIEMLLQSHAGELSLLPALPDAWPSGSVRGLRARGGFTVDMVWKDGALNEASLTADRDGDIKVRTRVPVTLTCDGRNMPFTHLETGLIECRASAGGTYRICADTA